MALEQIKKQSCGPFQKMLGLSTATELYGTKHNSPKFIVNMGQNCFTNNESIVLGLNHSIYKWCEDKEDLYECSDYVKGHEIQHIKSTTNKAWIYALERGTEVVIERLCKDNHINLRLSNKHDYEKAIQSLQGIGIYLNLNAVKHIVHFIANSLEDGRIEAIRAEQNGVFKKQMVHIRLLNWKNDGLTEKEIKPVDKMSASEKLSMILNQILSLATCSVYQKGFAKEYFGTELQERLEKVIPYIGVSVSAKRCRDMATNAIAICEILADLIGEAAKCDGFKEQIIQWIRASIKDIDNFEPGTKEENEEEGSGEGKTPFGQSDLYVILPDDEYDAIMDKMKDSQKEEETDGTTIHIRREHPKEEEPSEEVSDGEGSSAQSENEDSTMEGNTSESFDGQKETSDESGNAKGEDGKSTQSSEHSNNTGEEGESTGDGNMSSTGSGSSNSASGDNKSKGKNNADCSENSNSDTASDKEISDVEKQIEEQMEEAAKEAQGMAAENCETCEKIMEKQEKAQSMAEDQKEDFKPTDESVVSGINANYDENYRLIEKERKYEVDSLLPPELVKEIETMAKKLESLMQEAKKKWRKFINSGKLDSSRTAMLAANEINVFKEQKVSKGIKACAEILVDNSGSMGYGRKSKREYACLALAKIEMVFSKFFPIKMFAFDASSGAIIHEVIKGWNEHFSRSAAYNFLEKGRFGNSNFDGYSIRVATADILSRPEKKKLMIILSDGLPCYGGKEDVKEAVAEARRKGIQVIGIYFSNYEDIDTETTFKDMYQKDYIISSPEQISEELVKILKRFFL